MANVFKVTLKLLLLHSLSSLLLPFTGLNFRFHSHNFLFFGVIFNRKRISIFTFSESYSMPFLPSLSLFYGFENALQILISSKKVKLFILAGDFKTIFNIKSQKLNLKIVTRKASLPSHLFPSSMSRNAMRNEWKRAVKTF